MCSHTKDEFARFIEDFDFFIEDLFIDIVRVDGENKERFEILLVLLSDTFDSARFKLFSASEVNDMRDPESYREI